MPAFLNNFNPSNIAEKKAVSPPVLKDSFDA